MGENARREDLPVNPCKAKHLTNMRSQGEGKGIQWEAPLRMSLERTIEYIDSHSCRARIPVFTLVSWDYQNATSQFEAGQKNFPE